MPVRDCARLLLDSVPPTVRVIRAEMRAAARQEFTVPQFRTLGRLNLGPATNTELADHLGISTPTTTRLVSSLVRRKLVTRVRDTRDRRGVRLTLTAAGRRKFEALRREVQEVLAGRLQALSPAEAARLQAGLQILRKLFA